ncbi:MAG: lysophospholipid acyltransferase family protein [Alphaproteobacteria bacterium]
MTVLRSLLFQIAFYLTTTLLCLVYLPLLFLPRRWIIAGVKLWARIILFLLRALVGLDWRLEGQENLPSGPFLVAAKHQSAWETIAFNIIFHDPSIVLKQELIRIPLWGRYARLAEHIAVDRRGGATALRSMTAAAKSAFAKGRPVIIFPQGTRVPVGAAGASLPYQPGVAALYAALNVPVLPIALNSGLFWRRSPWGKKPGCITVKFLPALPPQQDKRRILHDLERIIETATAELEAHPD